MITALIQPAMVARAAVAAAVLAMATQAQGTQHLVNPGQDWQSLAPRLRPGDEIVLMPGRHRPAVFESLIGTAQKPIIIRGTDSQKPTVIESQREGIRIKRASHIIIKNFEITGGTLTGIAINVPTAKPTVALGPAIPDQSAQPADFVAQNVTIQNVSISRVGPRGQRHGIVVNDLQHVRIEHCRFEGWGGSGIEVIACRDALVSDCSFLGLNEHTQLCGVRVRAGSDDVRIEDCTFQNGGERAICLGASSNLEEFGRPLPENPPAAQPLTEAAHVSIQRCVITGSPCAIAFNSADDCTARNNTIVRPARCVIALLADQKDARFTTGQRNIFGTNIVVWKPFGLKSFIEADPRVKVDQFLLEQNVWWSGETSDQLKRLGGLPKSDLPQIMDTDPKLNEKMKPAEARLSSFGA